MSVRLLPAKPPRYVAVSGGASPFMRRLLSTRSVRSVPTFARVCSQLVGRQLRFAAKIMRFTRCPVRSSHEYAGVHARYPLSGVFTEATRPLFLYPGPPNACEP